MAPIGGRGVAARPRYAGDAPEGKAALTGRL
jgi:hypothetical protein